MNSRELLLEYDGLFGKKSLDEIFLWLEEKVSQAKRVGDWRVQISLYNEWMGLCRDTGKRECCLAIAEQLIGLMEHLKESEQEDLKRAMLCMNIANAFRVCNEGVKAEEYFRKTEQIYQRYLSDDDVCYVALYNNWSLLYLEKKAFAEAEVLQRKAFSCIEKTGDTVRRAIARVNLGNLLLQMGEAYFEEAQEKVDEALALFEQGYQDDFHYNAALGAKALLCCKKGDLVKASDYYLQAAREVKKHMGESPAYHYMMENYEKIQSKLLSR